jgi:hypothetical protein
VPSDCGTRKVSVSPLSVPWALGCRKYKAAKVSLTELPVMWPVNRSLLTDTDCAGAIPLAPASVIVPCK